MALKIVFSEIKVTDVWSFLCQTPAQQLQHQQQQNSPGLLPFLRNSQASHLPNIHFKNAEYVFFIKVLITL